MDDAHVAEVRPLAGGHADDGVTGGREGLTLLVDLLRVSKGRRRHEGGPVHTCGGEDAACLSEVRRQRLVDECRNTSLEKRVRASLMDHAQVVQDHDTVHQADHVLQPFAHVLDPERGGVSPGVLHVLVPHRDDAPSVDTDVVVRPAVGTTALGRAIRGSC